MKKNVLRFTIGRFNSCVMLCIMAFCSFKATAQNVFPLPSGNVGIGTATPTYPLTVVSGGNAIANFQSTGSTNSSITVSNALGFMNIGMGSITPHAYLWSNTNSLFIGNDGNPTLTVNGMYNGNVGIGATTPSAKLDINFFNPNGPVPQNGLLLETNSFYTGENSTNSYFLKTLDKGSGGVALIVKGNGQVGIGTENIGGSKLAVEGRISARGVKVTSDIPFPDYVFEPSYQLKPLAHLEQYINQNKHLPGIPSAEEVKKEGGVELGDMNVKLLEKVEELSLYIIEMNKKLEEQQKEIERLKNK